MRGCSMRGCSLSGSAEEGFMMSVEKGSVVFYRLVQNYNLKYDCGRNKVPSLKRSATTTFAYFISGSSEST